MPRGKYSNLKTSPQPLNDSNANRPNVRIWIWKDPPFLTNGHWCNPPSNMLMEHLNQLTNCTTIYHETFSQISINIDVWQLPGLLSKKQHQDRCHRDLLIWKWSQQGNHHKKDKQHLGVYAAPAVQETKTQKIFAICSYYITNKWRQTVGNCIWAQACGFWGGWCVLGEQHRPPDIVPRLLTLFNLDRLHHHQRQARL